MEPGTRLGRFEIVGPLGSGAMGTVYRARDGRIQRDVAIKVLPEALAENRDVVARLVREATALGALNHPHIATIHSVEDSDSGPFLVLEIVPGASLKERLAEGPPPVETALEIGRQVALALAAAHAAGIVHRDLKPANVMVADGTAAESVRRATRDTSVKVLDFGLAKFVPPGEPAAEAAPDASTVDLTHPGVLIGTPLYMSPEQVRGESVDERSDVWAFGCLLYELLAGRSAFGGATFADTMTGILEREPDLKALPATMPSSVRRMIEACLQKDHAARTITMADAATELDAALRPRPVEVRSSAGRKIAVGAVLALFVAMVLVIQHTNRQADERWAREVAIYEIDKLIGSRRYVEAVALAEKVEGVLGDDPVLRERWPRMARTCSVTTVPEASEVEVTAVVSPRFIGADIADAEQWRRGGTSPHTVERMPFGAYRVRIAADGYVPMEGIFLNHASDGDQPLHTTVELHEDGTFPPGMVPVPSKNLSAFVLGVGMLDPTPDAPPEPPYLIGKQEVTNREFKTFVDAGGYTERRFWKHDFLDGDRTLPFEEAMARFRDKSSRPGPATWDGGTYPPGKEEHPVGGVSWYEAAAYAEFAGASLPTIFHWHGARDMRLSLELSASSNFRPDGMLPVGSTPFGQYGVRDMAGNAREWAWNRSGTSRYILGGAWNDPCYMLDQGDLLPPFDRSPTNGLRLASYANAPADRLAPLLAQIERPAGHFAWGAPVGDDVYEALLGYYAYDRVPLEAEVESTDDSSPYWRKERVSFTAAYSQERMFGYLFLPKGSKPPYQVVVYFPGVGVMRPISSDRLQGMRILGPVIKSGRAVMYPIYKDTYERNEHLASNARSATRSYADHKIKWMKDVSRSVDYLASRDDIDLPNLAYLGLSWGAEMAPIALATDKRFRAAVLLDGGAVLQPVLREVDESKFAPRVALPVLMINGTHDYIFPVETTQRPLFELLGTPASDKRHVTLDGGHVIVNTHPKRVIQEILGWLDRLGRPH